MFKKKSKVFEVRKRTGLFKVFKVWEKSDVNLNKESDF